MHSGTNIIQNANDPIPVGVTSLPLPTGGATAAKQDTGNNSLSSIDGKITTVNTNAIAGSVGIQVAGSAVTSTNPVPVVTNNFVSTSTVTRPNDTTPYSAGDVIGASPATNTEFTNVGSIAGGFVEIKGISLEIDVVAIPSGLARFRFHFYNAAPTAIADNTAYNLPSGDRDKYLGYIDLVFNSDNDLGDTLFSNDDSITFKRKLASASTSLFCICQTLDAYTPTAQAVKKITIVG